MHKLPELPYAYEALEPYIDTLTMQIHHDKHHQVYINKLNDALKDYPELTEKSVEDLFMSLDSVPEKIRLTVKNNGGGHFNHALFWRIMKPKGNGEPKGKLVKVINKKFGDFVKFKEEFTKLSSNFFGSGWTWLVANKSGELEIMALPNHDCLITIGLRPLLVLDLWEHAYYLKYQNRRAEYIEAWWNVVNWDEVEKNYTTVN
jgi:Fe-Mn family superoxide dismutase